MSEATGRTRESCDRVAGEHACCIAGELDHELSLADCRCLATGIRLELPVVGGDMAWRDLRLGVDVHPFG